MSTNPFWLDWLPGRVGARLRGRGQLVAVIHNTGWLFADKAMRMLIGVVVGAWVARYLGPSQFGEISYVLSYVALFGAAAQLGLDAIAVRDIARDARNSPEVLGTVFGLKLAAGLLGWAIAVAVMAFLRPGDSQTLLLTVVCAGMLALQAADTVDLWFQSQTQSRRTVVAKVYGYLGANALKVLLIVTRSPLLAFVLVGVIELAISAAVLWFSYRQFPASGSWRWSSARAAALLRESFPYLAAGLAVLIYMRIDQLMIRSMIGEHELGLYSAILPLSSALHVIPMALCMSIAPTMARLRERDQIQYELAVGRLFSAMWWTVTPLAALVAILAPVIVSILYGPAYAGSGPMLSVHAFSAVPVALGVAQSVWIVNERRNMISLYRTAIGATCNVTLNLLLIPRYGGLGAAWAAIAAQATAAIFSNLILAPAMFRLQLASVFNFNARMPSK